MIRFEAQRTTNAAKLGPPSESRTLEGFYGGMRNSIANRMETLFL